MITRSQSSGRGRSVDPQGEPRSRDRRQRRHLPGAPRRRIALTMSVTTELACGIVKLEWYARHPQGGPEDVASPPNDGMPVQRRPCFAHDRRPGVEATGGAVCSCYRVVLERAA